MNRLNVVIDLRHPNYKQAFSCSPREAVIAAYAQDRGDMNTWDYEQKYGALVRFGKVAWHCGDFSCLSRLHG